MNFIKILFWPITAPIAFIQKNFKTVLFLTILYFVFVNSDTKNLEQPNLQKIDLVGPIMMVDEILEKIEIAKNDPHIKGVLLNVNSPGGAVAPSVELAYAIKELSKTKPVVAYASGIMASGGYYASIWADQIIANPGSMIGSIGVIMQSVDASELIAKIGIKPQTVKVGDYKEAGTPTRQWTALEKQELEKITQDTYNMFVQDVSNARKLQPQDHKTFADAHIFTATQAKDVGLVDSVATISSAKAEVEKLSGVDVAIWAKEDKMEKFMEKLLNGSIQNISTLFSHKLMAY
ncbi:MAG: signal peptide peptidase SppA [Campylobacterales bacterium]|nr:signal peptide peptidase SppA [Campylobacterales bacterium]